MCRNADISVKPLRTGINYIVRVYKDSLCTSQETRGVSIRKRDGVRYEHNTEHRKVLMDKMRCF